MKKKIPDHAERVFKGVLFDIYQWQQEMFDGSFATFEAVKRKDLVCIIAITSDNRFLVNYEEQPNVDPFMSMPKGRIEEGEDYLGAAKRELREETGHTSQKWETLRVVDILGTNKIEWDAHYFIARDVEETESIQLDPGEKITTVKLTLEEMLDKLEDPSWRIDDFSNRLKMIKDDPEKLEDFRKEIFGS